MYEGHKLPMGATPVPISNGKQRMNGWDFLEAMKNNTKGHRIIVLSSSTSKLDIEKAKQYPNVIKYLVKPLNKKKFSELSKFLKAS